MPNNIVNLQNMLAERDRENTELAAETFDESSLELTPEEREKLKELDGKREIVVKETSTSGATSTVPMETFMESVDKEVATIKNATGEIIGKGLNTGDIKQTMEDLKREEQKKAIQMFRDNAVDTDVDLDDDDIIAINNRAIAKIQEFLKVDKLDSNDIIRRFKRMTLREIANIIPKEFMDIYVRPNELLANSLPAKERLIATLAYLSVTGPEMDYLNDYIDHEHKLMMLSQRLIECQVKMADAIKSQDTLVSMAKRANEISPMEPDSPWTKYIKGDPKKVHSEFAQKAVISQMMKESYEELLKEYKDDPECAAQIQEQITESEIKYETYISITELKLMRELWSILTERLKVDKRGSYKNLEREAISAMDRIRRAKQNVSFPIYADGNPGNHKPEVLYSMYVKQYPNLLAECNRAINSVRSKDPDAIVGTEDIQPIEIEGIDNAVVHEYFAILLLIIFGRIMKKLSPVDQTKYQAIELDMYFVMYCKLVTDVYLMNDVWTMMKDFVEYAIKTWPKPKGRKK